MFRKLDADGGGCLDMADVSGLLVMMKRGPGYLMIGMSDFRPFKVGGLWIAFEHMIALIFWVESL